MYIMVVNMYCVLKSLMLHLQLVAFDKLRLTNRNMGADFVFLESFHKYTPIVYILPVNRDGQPTREV